MNILITGGSGLIGTELTKVLHQNNHKVHHLSRNQSSQKYATVHQWDPYKKKIDSNVLKNIDAVIHLAGAGIADGRWTKKRKVELTDSRIKSTNYLCGQIEQMKSKPKLIITASGIGYYGSDTGQTWLSEEDKVGNDFLARLCLAWEEAANQFEAMGIRLVTLRMGLVLSNYGGALKKMVQPVNYGIGSALGSGEQYISWIHIDDLCRLVLHVLKNDSIAGTFNTVSSRPETNATFTRVIAGVLRKPLFMPNVPIFVLKLVFGELASIILGGNRVSNKKIIDSDFQFKFKELEVAIRDILE